jgi:hypothetical protein
MKKKNALSTSTRGWTKCGPESSVLALDRSKTIPLFKVNYLYFLSICLGCGNGVTAFAGCSI